MSSPTNGHPIISFVIPCLNEEATLAGVIFTIKQAVAELKVPCEIIVADNNSSDKSRQIAEAEHVRVVSVVERGYGAALRGGINSAQGEIIVMGDADTTYNFLETVPMINALINEDLDFVMGSRLSGKIEKGAMPFLNRYFGTPLISFLIRFIFKTPISDANCGLRVFTKKAFNKLVMLSDGMEFASEMLIKAGILKLKMKEMPCSLSVPLIYRKPHLRPWRDGLRHLKFICLFAPDYIFKFPGFLISIISLLCLFAFRDTLMLMFTFSLSLLLGYQMIWLAKFEKGLVQYSGLQVGTSRNTSSFKMYIDRWLSYSALLFFVGAVLLVYGAYNNNVLVWGMLFLAIAAQTAVNVFLIGMMSLSERTEAIRRRD